MLGRVDAVGMVRSRPVRESAWLVGMYALYNVGRMVAARHTGDAFKNADQVWSFERMIGLPNEQAVQELVLDLSHRIVELANVYYASVHFPLTLLVLVFLYVRHADVYLWTRRTLVMVSLAALAGFLVYPLAPPRMLTSLGFVDTGQMFGLSVYNPTTTTSLTNQFAAMPSLHVAWAALIAIAMIRAWKSRWRMLWLIHPILTFFVVIVTANHYWMDGLVGLAILLVAMTIAYSQESPVLVPEPQLQDAR